MGRKPVPKGGNGHLPIPDEFKPLLNAIVKFNKQKKYIQEEMTNEIRRIIAIKDYYGKGKHVYQDEMGFRKEMKDEARSLVSREVFRYHIEQIGLNLGFYYPPTDTFYAIYNDARPVEVYTMPRDRRRSDFIGWQCDCNPHEEDQLIATFDDITDVWDGLKIDGKDFEDVINHSYIVALN